jgi:hypothetical protein
MVGAFLVVLGFFNHSLFTIGVGIAMFVVSGTTLNLD